MSDVTENTSVVEQNAAGENTANENAALNAQDQEHNAGAEASVPKRTRETVLNDLRELGWTGPTSYTKTHLEKMVRTLRDGGTIEVKPRGRRAAAKPEGEGENSADPTEGAADVQTAEEADQSQNASA